MVIYIDPANQAPVVQTGPSIGIKIFHRLIMGKIKKIFFFETMRPTAYIFSMFPHSVVPYINPANQAPGIQTGPSQGIKHFNRLIMGKNLKP